MALKSKRITVTIPGEFVELLEHRKREEHIPTDSKYFLSLLIFDLATRCPHSITGQVVNEPESFFYKVVDEVVREFPTARKNISSWLKHRIQEMRAQNAQPSPPEVDGPKAE
jgi:hypothetical protein